MWIDDTLFYRVVLTVTVSIIFFTLCALGIVSCTLRWKHWEEGRYPGSRLLETDESKEDVHSIRQFLLTLQY
jgi:hypothetical protein